MKSKIQVQMTERDIQRGIKQSASLCPIARAVRRATKQKGVIALSSQIIVGNTWYSTSCIARVFINKFDTDKSVELISFTLG